MGIVNSYLEDGAKICKLVEDSKAIIFQSKSDLESCKDGRWPQNYKAQMEGLEKYVSTLHHFVRKYEEASTFPQEKLDEVLKVAKRNLPEDVYNIVYGEKREKVEVAEYFSSV